MTTRSHRPADDAGVRPAISRQRAEARQLERLAGELHNLAFDYAEPARSHHEVERRADECRRISREVDAVGRGRGALTL